MSSDLTYLGGSASRDSMGPDEPRLTVTTDWLCPTPDWELWLVPAKGGGELELKLVALKPWWPVPKVLTPTRAVYTVEAPDPIKFVRIDGGGEIPVLEVTAAETQSDPSADLVMIGGRPDQPNHFELTGDGIALTYDSAAIDGLPRLNLQREGKTTNYAGEEIHVNRATFGTVVSVTTEVAYDALVRTLNVILPAVNIRDESAPVETLALISERRMSIGGDRLLDGQITFVSSTQLTGTASTVRS